MPDPLMPPPPFANAPVAAGLASSMSEPAGASAAWNVRRSGVFMPTPILMVALALLVACLAVTFGLGCVVGRWIGP